MRPRAFSYKVDDHFFPLMETKIVRGRGFDSRDTAKSPRVAVINELLANKLFGKNDPIGRRFRLDSADGPELQVVGVAKQGIYTYWAEPAQEAVWTPFSQDYSSQMYVEMRTAGDPAAFAAVVREQVRALDPGMPIFRISTMATFFHDRAMLGPRLIAQIVTATGVMGLFMAVIGLYGVVAYAVSRRTREIGIRLAIGATPAGVMRMVLNQGAVFTAVGLAIGLALVIPIARKRRSELCGRDRPLGRDRFARRSRAARRGHDGRLLDPRPAGRQGGSHAGAPPGIVQVSDDTAADCADSPHHNHRTSVELCIASAGTWAAIPISSCPCANASTPARFSGPEIVAAGPILDDAPASFPYRRRVTNARQATETVADLKRAGVDFIKVHDHTPREVFFAIAAEAPKLGLTFAGHVPQGVTIEEAADAGIHSIEHLSNYDVFGECLVNDSYTLAGCRRLFEKLAAKGVWQTPTMAFFQTIPDVFSGKHKTTGGIAGEDGHPSRL